MLLERCVLMHRSKNEASSENEEEGKECGEETGQPFFLAIGEA